MSRILEALSTRPDAPPVAVVTGDDTAERAVCPSAGVSAVLTKPFSIAALRTEVRAQVAAGGGAR